MFATLLGPLPRPPLADDAPAEALLDACLAVQVEHALEPLTDGGWPPASTDAIDRWRATDARVDGLLKAVVEGPVSSGRSAATVRREVIGLADAGCRWIEVHEPSATRIGPDPAARTRFAEAHRELTADLGPDVHLSLAIIGGSADAAGIETILSGPYASLALDLIDGPDNWRLAVAAPMECGIVCGALSAHAGSDDAPEPLVWAAGYAAAGKGRGIVRVGLATSGSMAHLSWEAATAKIRRLADATRLVSATPEERQAALDPRAIDIRSAALGRRPRST